MTWIAFDLGGVLLTDGSITAWEALEEQFGIPSAASSRLWYERYQRLLDVGQASEEELWHDVAQLGAEASPERIREVYLGEYRPIAFGIQVMTRAQERGWSVALATNNVNAWLDAWRDLHPWMSRFDAVCCSADLGVRKPAPEFYSALIEMTEPGAYFVDDKIENVEAAKTSGLAGILADAADTWRPPEDLA